MESKRSEIEEMSYSDLPAGCSILKQQGSFCIQILLNVSHVFFLFELIY